MTMNKRTGYKGLVLALSLLWPAAAQAAVEIGFHSRAMGSSFPHGLIVLRGTVDATGERVDANYGFTVRNLIGPSVLFGRVEGQVASETRDYVAGTKRHFSLQLSDDQYRRVMRLIDRWRSLPQPSYSLDRRNCVTFVAAVATELGLAATPDHSTIRQPRAFLDRVVRQNRMRIDEWLPGAPSQSALQSGVGR
jgi:hypothetical protein